MKWVGLERFSDDTFYEVVAFRGMFYVSFLSAGVLVLDPYSLEVTPLIPTPPLVQPISNFVRSEWVAVSDLGGRVFFIGHFGNVCCSGEELPDGCGVSGDSILFTNELGGVTFAFKYSVHTGGEGDGVHGVWRLSREYRVSILSHSPVVALRVERQPMELENDWCIMLSVAI